MSLDFFSSIEIAFFIDKSLNMSQVYLIYSIFSVLIFLLEIPTGYIGDKLGYKISMQLGFLCGVIGSIGFIVGEGFVPIIISYFFMALMTSLISGSDDALIYDSLKEEYKEGLFEKIYSKIKAYGYAATILRSCDTSLDVEKIRKSDMEYDCEKASAGAWQMLIQTI